MATGRNNAVLVLGILLLGGCASLPWRHPAEVLLAGVEPLKGAGLEMRLLVKLRIQNPSDRPLEFNGVSVRMDVQGKRFATGVSEATGRIPRFGETVVEVPVSIPAFSVARQALGVLTSEYRGTLAYEMSGTLAGPIFRSVDFKTKGEFTLPAQLFENP